MPSKKKPSTALSRRLSKSLKKHHARARQIHKKQPLLSYQEARHVDAETLIETVRRGTRRTVQIWRQYRELPSRFKKVKRGLEREALGVQVWDERTKRRYLEGHWIDRKGMARVEASYTYWGLVDRIARMFELPMMQARELLTRVRAEMEAVARRAKAMGTNFSGRVKMRTRDAAWVLENSDRYPKIRMEFGI